RLVGGSDVEEHELVGSLAVVALGELDRITGIPQPDEVRALDHPPLVDVQARDNPLQRAHRYIVPQSGTRPGSSLPAPAAPSCTPPAQSQPNRGRPMAPRARPAAPSTPTSTIASCCASASGRSSTSTSSLSQTQTAARDDLFAYSRRSHSRY